MKYQFGTLVFTGKGTRKVDKETARNMGIDPNYFYLGKLNRDRTVAATVIELCKRGGSCNSWDVYNLIKFYTRELILSGKFYHEFPDKNEDFEYMSEQDVKRHLSSVVRRSQEGASKFIPRGIERLPYATECFIFRGGMKMVGATHAK